MWHLSWGREKLAKVCWETLKERHCLEDIGTDWQIG